MSISHSLTRAVAVAAAACSLLAAGAAQAGIVGTFDPAFGGTDPSLANLGFRGSFSADVSSGCYNAGGGYEYNNGYDGCQITMTSLEVDFYDTRDPGTTVASVNVMDYIYPPYYVQGAYFDPGSDTFVAFDSDYSDPFPVSAVNFNGDMILYFVSGYAPPSDCEDNECTAAINIGASFDDAYTPPTPGAYLIDQNTFTTSNPAAVTITTTVPEPGTMPLALLGLAALAAVRLRAWKPSAGRRLAN